MSDRDKISGISSEVSDGLDRIAASANRRGHATWFHVPREFQGAMERAYVEEWAKVVNERFKWNVREVQKNSDTYPDCVAQFDGVNKQPSRMGIEFTELVDRGAIDAHQQLRRVYQTREIFRIPTPDLVKLHERTSPPWSFQAFEKHLKERVLEKNLRSRDSSFDLQILLIATDEPALDDVTVDAYVRQLQFLPVSNFDKIFLMLSYRPQLGAEGRYPVFEIPMCSVERR